MSSFQYFECPPYSVLDWYYIASTGTLDATIALRDDSVDSVAVLIGDGLHLEILEDGGDSTRGVRVLPPAEDGDLLAGLHLLPGLWQTERRHPGGQLREGKEFEKVGFN